MKDIRYVFFGTPRFARIVLEELLAAGFTPRAVVCNPDRPQGRSHAILPPPTKQLIVEQGLVDEVKVLQPEQLGDVRDELAALEPDVFVIAAYGKIIKPDILAIPRLGTIGVHPSILPAYRGPTPFQSALLDGRTDTGVSLFLVDELMDHGPVFAEEAVTIVSEDTYLTLEEKLARVGGKLLVRSFPEFIAGELYSKEQDDTLVTATRKFTTQDGNIPWEEVEQALADNVAISRRIHNMIRAFNPAPSVWTMRDGKRLKLLKSSLSPVGSLMLEEVQWEGKKPSKYRG